MQSTSDRTLGIEDVSITGHAQLIKVRSYLPASKGALLPIVIYFHGGGFVRGLPDDAEIAAATIARRTQAWVVSVGYSLSPQFPFPAALEDGYRATQWAVANARAQGADARRMGVAGHDAGGNLATCLAAVARDRGQFAFSAQALLAPLLDPSMTRMAKADEIVAPDLGARECATLSSVFAQCIAMAPSVRGPIESRRLAGLPPALIASAEHDLLHVEAEKYASELIAAGMPTEVARHCNASHHELGTHPAALADVVIFFQKRLHSKALRR